MSTYEDYFPSEWLKVADLGNAEVNLTIKSVSEEEVGQNKEKRPIITFTDDDKKLILNRTNFRSIAMALGTEDDLWAGQQITLYPDQTTYQGKPCPCIRIRLPLAKPTKAEKAKKAAEQAEAIDDKVPF